LDAIRIDALQYANWSPAIFAQWRQARLGAVHATVAYHLSFRAVVDEIVTWNWRFRDHADLIAPVRDAPPCCSVCRTRSRSRTISG